MIFNIITYSLYCFIVLLGLFLLFNLFVGFLMQGGKIDLGTFKNTQLFEKEMELKIRNKKLYNRQSIDIIFVDDSKVNLFDSVAANSGSNYNKTELNEFVKNFKIHSIKNVKVLDKNNNLINHDICKGFKYSGESFINIQLSVENFKNIKSISFESTTPIDVRLEYSYYGY